MPTITTVSLSVEVPRSQWLRGETGTLMDTEDCACILGHIGLAAGIPRDELRGQTDIAGLEDGLIGLFPEKLVDKMVYEQYLGQDRIGYEDSEISRNLVDNNDSTGVFHKTDDALREEKLIELAAQADIELTFTGDQRV